MTVDSRLDFAYKYPFSKEAKVIVSEKGSAINPTYLDMGSRQLESAISGKLGYSSINLGSAKLDYIMTYPYVRMLISALRQQDMIRAYATAEAARSTSAMQDADPKELICIVSQLGIRLEGTFNKQRNDAEGFSMEFTDYVNNAPNAKGFELVNQNLCAGIVVLEKNKLIKVIGQAIIREISKGLPIRIAELPKQVVDYSKSITIRMPAIANLDTKNAGGRRDWIERLLQTPIPDVRHRTVNLILAPYLVNTKGLDVEQASKIISNYIEKCKLIDPNTKINDSYIRYQCEYAKKRGLKPLSMERAEELLGRHMDFGIGNTANKTND